MKVSEAQLLARVKNLPALPQAVMALMNALRHDGVKSDTIVGLIASDQALTVTALRLANSSFYGVSGRVATLRDAVNILGLNTLSAVMMTAAVMAKFERTSCPHFDFDENWRHAIATAIGAQMLAQERGLDACEAYTAGLLHDIGRLALAAHFPQELDAALAWGAEHDLPPIDAERVVMGIDHATAGAMIAAHWRLAPAIVDAIRLHHDVPHDDVAPDAGNGALLDVLHLADTVVHALDLSHSPEESVPPLSLASWERLHVGPTELQQVFERIETRMQDFGGSLSG